MAKNEALVNQLYGMAHRNRGGQSDDYIVLAIAAWGLAGHPKAIAIWDHAWDNHHSEGVQAVLDEFDTLVGLLA